MHRVDLVPVAARDEPRLERERAGGRLDERAQRIVGRGQELRLEAERVRNALRRLRERHALAQELGAHEMQADVAVAEPEPRLAAELRDGVERLPRLARAAPAALLVGEAGERVEDAVQIGRDPKAQHLDVVRDVAYDGNVAWIDYTDEAAQEPRATDAAREDRDVHAADSRCSEASTRRVCGPSRSASRARSSGVSTSSMRFGASIRIDGASAANRSALPGP